MGGLPRLLKQTIQKGLAGEVLLLQQVPRLHDIPGPVAIRMDDGRPGDCLRNQSLSGECREAERPP